MTSSALQNAEVACPIEIVPSGLPNTVRPLFAAAFDASVLKVMPWPCFLGGGDTR